MVGGLVQQQHVGTRQKQAAQGHAALFATREVPDLGIPRRQTQGIGRNFHLRGGVGAGRRDDGFQTRLLSRQGIKVGIGLGVGGVHGVKLGLRLHHFAHALFDGLSHGGFGIELRLLRQITDLEIVLPGDFAVDVLVDAGHDLQKGRFARAVKAQNADLGPREERQRDVFENLSLGRNHLAHAIHGHDVLSHLS